MQKHQSSLGGWTFVFADYYNENITRLLEHPRIVQIMDLVNPYSTTLYAPPSANNIAWGDHLPDSSISVMDNNVLSAEPWWRPTFISNLSVDPNSVLTDVVHPSCMYCITLMYSSPTFFFLSAHYYNIFWHSIICFFEIYKDHM